MSGNKKFYAYILTIVLSGFSLQSFSQIKIDGPECVLPGTEYQYNFYGKWQRDADITVCITGGTIASDKNSCYTGKNYNSVRVIWNDNIKKGSIAVSSGSDKESLSVIPTIELYGGNIDTSAKLQAFDYKAKSPAIKCSAAKGGSCNPSYSYQWEQSDDNLRWTEVKGATSQDFVSDADPDHTIFLRRKTVEQKSGLIAYSDVSILFVKLYAETN